jgi:hypothetical protein
VQLLVFVVVVVLLSAVLPFTALPAASVQLL